MSVPTLTRNVPADNATFADVWNASASWNLAASDSHCAEAWGLTAWQWIILTDTERRDYRSRIAYAGTYVEITGNIQVHRTRTGK